MRIIKILSDIRRYVMFYVVWPAAFNLFSLKKPDCNQIIFAVSKNYNTLPDNMVPLYNKLKDRYKCIILFAPKSQIKRMIFGIKFQKYYAQSGTVFITDNFDQLYAHKPNKGTRVVQLWHACGAFKKWGYSALDSKWGGSKKDMLRFPMHNTYTHVFISSPFVADKYAEAFNCCTEIIKPLGVPRTDVYFNSEFIKESKDKLPEVSGKKIILYAPTFRGDSPEKSFNNFNLDFENLKERLSDEYVFYIKAHPFTSKKLKDLYPDGIIKPGFAYTAENINIDTLLCACDLLITDYSSLIFEYALLNKPALFYAYDLEEYDKNRSFYYDYNDFVPGKIVKTEKEMINAIEDKDFNSEKTEEFRKKFMSSCDGHSTEKIINYLF